MLDVRLRYNDLPVQRILPLSEIIVVLASLQSVSFIPVEELTMSV